MIQAIEAGMDAGESAARSLKCAILDACDHQVLVAPAIEAQVQRALDRLRAAHERGDRLRTVEGMSCMLERMILAQRTGQTNLYASSVARLRKTAEGL